MLLVNYLFLILLFILENGAASFMAAETWPELPPPVLLYLNTLMFR